MGNGNMYVNYVILLYESQTRSRHEATNKHVKLFNEQQQLSTEQQDILKSRNDKLKERKAQYYNRNKESIIRKERERYERKKETVNCDCGCKIYKHNMPVHCNCIKQQQLYLQTLEPVD